MQVKIVYVTAREFRYAKRGSGWKYDMMQEWSDCGDPDSIANDLAGWWAWDTIYDRWEGPFDSQEWAENYYRDQEIISAA